MLINDNTKERDKEDAGESGNVSEKGMPDSRLEDWPKYLSSDKQVDK